MLQHNYTIYRSDRKLQKDTNTHGGVMVGMKNTINCEMLINLTAWLLTDLQAWNQYSNKTAGYQRRILRLAVLWRVWEDENVFFRKNAFFIIIFNFSQVQCFLTYC